MAKTTIPTKRKKQTEQSPPQPPPPIASTSAQPLPPPQLSAVATRKAALAASAQSTPIPSATPSSDEEDVDSDADIISLASEDEDVQAREKAKKPPRPKKKPKGAGRYFMAPEEDGEPQRIGMEVDEDQPEGVTDEVILDGERALAKSLGKGKLGRGKRQRREKSAFSDPSCVSSFVPVLEQNAFKVTWTRSEDAPEHKGILLCLKKDETLIIHGTAAVSPIFGSFTLLGATISSPPPSTPLAFPPLTSHLLFAPSSHPLPPLEALQLPLGDKTPSLLLPDGRAVDLSDFSTVLLVSDSATGIEGVETVLRNGGMGAGNGMWDVGGKVDWSGVGWRLVLDVTPSLTSLRIPDSWAATMLAIAPSKSNTVQERTDGEDSEDEEVDASVGAERMVVLVEGPKHVGKSTFARLVVNRLLSRYERVAYLDTDLGQPEFTPPGLVSLNVVDKPILGPSFTHPSIPIAAHFLGSTSPASDPSSYLSVISALLATYALEVEYPLVDEPTRRHPRRNHTAPTTPSKIRDRVPLVINTQGWVKGLGADLLLKLKTESRPTHLLLFSGSSEDADQDDDSSFHDNDTEPAVVRYRLEAAPSSPLDAKWSAADLRTLAFISYFHSTFPCPSLASPPTTLLATRWDFSLPLVSRPPFAVSWTDREVLSSVHLIDAEVPYEQVLHVLNASIVALVRSSPSSPPSSLDNDSNDFPYSPTTPFPPSSSSRTLGLSLLRSIDPASSSLHLLTPLPSALLAQEPVALVKGPGAGGIELPVCLVLDWGGRGEEERTERGVCGVEWREVVYFGGEGEGSGRRKVRRNLMRRGQN